MMEGTSQLAGYRNLSLQSRPETSFRLDPSFMDMCEATATKTASLQVQLNRRLGPEHISQRPGPGGGPRLTYVEGWKLIQIANEVFGFNGWSSSVISLTTDFIDVNEESKRCNAGVTAIVRVTLRDGTYHEDIGYGTAENAKSKGAALDKCKKEAVTDGLKRALRNFGNLLGNCLYDKHYTQEVVKLKAPPRKFDPSELYSGPNIEEAKPLRPPESEMSLVSEPCAPSGEAMIPRPRRTAVTQHNRPESSVPKGKAPAVPTLSTGLNTPKTTPTAQSHAMKQENQCLPTNRRVAFVEPGADVPNADESFTFDSDDVAFLDAVRDTDTLPGDDVTVGRRTRLEDKAGESRTGRDEGRTSRTIVGDKVAPMAAGSAVTGILVHNVVARPGQTSNAAPSRLQQAGAHRPTADLKSSAHDERLQRTLVQPPVCALTIPQSQITTTRPQNAGQSRLIDKAVCPDANTHLVNSEIRQRQQRGVLPTASSGSIVSREVQSIPSAPAIPEGKRPTTPSVGGFHFPPGMKGSPPSNGQTVRPPQNGQQPSAHRPIASTMSTHAVKRSADGVQRPVQGLGLAQQQVAMKREPLGQLEVGERGEVKRMRR